MESLAQFRSLLYWNFLRQKSLFILFTLAQMLLTISLVFGYPLIMGELDLETTRYLASGSVLIGIISSGCTISSPVVSHAKNEGHVDYLRALPVPRLLISLADLTIWFLAMLPGLVIAIFLGQLKFNVPIFLTPSAAGAILLITLTMISLGFSIAYVFPPNIVNLISQLILMLGLMFSPIMYPADRLPAIINHIYRFLPFVPAADLLRATLYAENGQILFDTLILGCWFILTQVIIFAWLKHER